MPTYLLHGFRWPRPLIRIHVILQNLDDVATEWLVAPNTTLELLRNFNELHPDLMKHLPQLRFVEQYDEKDEGLNGVSQPFAYVADMVEEVKLGVEVDEVRGRGLNTDQWTSIMALRDKLAPEEKVGWYIVVCADEERAAPTASSDSSEGSNLAARNRQSVQSGASPPTSSGKGTENSDNQEPKGLRKLFGSTRLGRHKRYASASRDA